MKRYPVRFDRVRLVPLRSGPVGLHSGPFRSLRLAVLDVVLMRSVPGAALAAVDWASLLLWDLNIVSQSPSREVKEARKARIFVLAQKCG